LEPHSMRSADFTVQSPDATGAMRVIPAPAPSTYRGVVEGMAEARVAAAVLDGRIEALILTEEAQWAIEPLAVHQPGAEPDLHLVYRAADLIEPEGFCGVDEQLAGHTEPAPGPAVGVDATLICEVAADSDYEYFQLRGSSAAVISGIEQVLNAAELIYERDIDVTFEIPIIVVRDAPFPTYGSTQAETLLNQFGNEWQRSFRSQRRDIAHLFTGKELAGSTIGIAWLSGLCTSTSGYGVDQMRGISLTGRVGLFSHELGHNFSAPHCSGSDCRIMCPGLGGCTGDISHFGSSSRSRMRSFAAGRPCLEEVVTALDLPFADEFPSATLDAVKWPEASNIFVTFGTNPPSAPYAMNIRAAGLVRSEKIILPPPAVPADQAFISFWTQHRLTEAGKGMTVEYFSSGGAWKLLDTVLSDGSDQDFFVFHEYKAPFDAYGEEFQLRLRALGLDAGDVWFVDNVEIDTICRVDLTGDGALDFFDFLAFQTLFSQSDPRADFTGDGAFDFFDFLAFQNAFTAGC
ncbi:MAG: M12 family metallo-peptidase, partial [Phycisphaerales bacterium JB039]